MRANDSQDREWSLPDQKWMENKIPKAHLSNIFGFSVPCRHFVRKIQTDKQRDLIFVNSKVEIKTKNLVLFGCFFQQI
jgi:hypothetical protein